MVANDDHDALSRLVGGTNDPMTKPTTDRYHYHLSTTTTEYA